jgi:hypothetical protein
MIYIKVTPRNFIFLISGLIFVVFMLTSILCNQRHPPHSHSRPPCNCSDTNHPYLKTDKDAFSLIQSWEKERLHELWPAQGLSEHDINGGMNPRQGKRYAEIAYTESKNQVKVVCESGFFRGGSTLFWMMLFENSVVHSFDISFPENAIKWFEAKYPGRLVIHEGDSKQLISTMPKNTCDWVSVDGDHGPGGAYNDIKEFSKVSKPRTILVSDDTFDCILSQTSCTECNENCPCKGKRSFCNECSHGFQQTVLENVVDWMGCDRYGVSQDGKYPIGSCYGYINLL